jgi:hypothetical protein
MDESTPSRCGTLLQLKNAEREQSEAVAVDGGESD